MAKKLHYFHLNGLAESIRYILHYAGEKFEDIRYNRADWPIKSVKDNLPYGQLPLYEEGNKSLNQSLAIARYLANKTGLLPTDTWEQALLDAIVLNIYDFWGKVVQYLQEKDATKKEALGKEFLAEVVPFYFTRFEKELLAGKGYFAGKLTWADFILVGIVETVNLFFSTTIEKDYPSVNALIKKIVSLPRVKDYIATRKPYTA